MVPAVLSSVNWYKRTGGSVSTTLCYQFSTGTTPHQYVLRCRIDMARLLLARDRISVADVALLLGFSNQSHFTEVFRRHVGLILELKHGPRVLHEVRKACAWYARGLHGGSRLRTALWGTADVGHRRVWRRRSPEAPSEKRRHHRVETTKIGTDGTEKGAVMTFIGQDIRCF